MNTRLSLILCLVAAVWAQRGGPPLPPSAQRAQQLFRAGSYAEAEAAFRKAVADAPDSAAVYNAAGTAFDLMGKSPEARKYFQKAIDLAATPAAKSAAQRAMAMSFAFEGDCKNTAKYEDLASEYFRTSEDAPDRFYQQGELADEAARVCIDAGDLDTAETYYKKGRDAGLKQPNIPGDRIPDYKNITLQNVIATTPGDVLIAGKDSAHVTEIKLDGVFINQIKPDQIHAQFARITLDGRGTTMKFMGNGVTIDGRITIASDNFDPSVQNCSAKFLPMN